jgi:hypothetical protein
VPAGILLGFGSFVALSEQNLLPDQGGGWFVVMLGLGFLAVYAIGLRPAAVWPFYPAAALLVFGSLLLGLVAAWPLASLAWVGAYWPLVLVLVGLWLLLRDRLPAAWRQPVATLGTIILILYGILALSATLALVGLPAAALGRVRVAMPGFSVPVGTTINLAAPIEAGETFRVTNSSGQTTIRPVAGNEVRVVATTHVWPPDRQFEARLTPVAGGVTLEGISTQPFEFGTAYADYVIELPAGAQIEANSASGDIVISGFTGPVRASSASGQITLTDLSGAVTVRSVSGDLRLTNLSGETRLGTTSGDVQASNLLRLREATSVSGDLRLSGLMRDSARVQTVSGDVGLTFASGSAARLEVNSLSGDIRTNGARLSDTRSERRSLTTTLGAGGELVTINTTSGDVTVRTSD